MLAGSPDAWNGGGMEDSIDIGTGICDSGWVADICLNMDSACGLEGGVMIA